MGIVAEPLTALTDYGIALECLIFAGLLWRLSRAEWLWASAFASVSFAAALGGTYHALGEWLTAEPLAGLWQGTLLALAIASFLTLMAEARRLPRYWQWGLLVLATAKLIGLLTVEIQPLSFALGVGDYLLSLGMAGLIQWRKYWSREAGQLRIAPSTSGPKWMLSGVLISGAAAMGLLLPDGGQLSPLVLYHGVQMVALYCIFRSVRAIARCHPGDDSAEK
ncbi:hypothetical protein C7271_23125 [filamentous cyanobacterium CCP5]|nr:hypothetical protein C7271_23125 [filamentous cyanobacterium CCP5]